MEFYFGRSLIIYSFAHLVCIEHCFYSWKNTSKDTLTCVNPECSACLSITFDRDPPSEATSLAAWNRLGLDYRKQLLTAHVPYCSFRCEAQCWFPPTGTDLTANTTSVVPSFLLSVIPEMILFENQSSDKVQIQLIYQTILHKSSDFDNFLVKFSTSLSNSSESRKDYRYRVVDPDPVKSFVREQKRIVNNENQPLSLDLKTLLDEWCSSHSNLTTENGGEEDVHSCHNNATIGRLYRTQQSVLLATLGWSLVASSNIQKGVSHQRNYIIVECPCCVSRALVPITTDTSDNNDDFITQEDSGGKEPSGASTKRVRVIDTTQNATRSTSGTNRMFWRTAPQSSSTKPTITAENRPMHPLTSHRHFCPYLGGSLLHNRIGWEIIINRMLQWKTLHDKSN